MTISKETQGKELACINKLGELFAMSRWTEEPLADMMELGDKSPEYHRQVGEFIKGMKVDELVLLGSLASYIGEGAGASDIKITQAETRQEAEEYLEKTLRAGDAVLFKGSRVMELNRCVEALKKSKEEAKNGQNN